MRARATDANRLRARARASNWRARELHCARNRHGRIYPTITLISILTDASAATNQTAVRIVSHITVNQPDNTNCIQACARALRNLYLTSPVSRRARATWHIAHPDATCIRSAYSIPARAHALRAHAAHILSELRRAHARAQRASATRVPQRQRSPVIRRATPAHNSTRKSDAHPVRIRTYPRATAPTH